MMKQKTKTSAHPLVLVLALSTNVGCFQLNVRMDASVADGDTVAVDVQQPQPDGEFDVPNPPIDRPNPPICDGGNPSLGGRCVEAGIFPRPLLPLSLGDVSLLRPTLHWELPAGADGAAVDLCSDRACTTVIESFRAMGNSGRPANPLPAHSVVFWRLRATVGDDTAPTYSPTWLFHTPATNNSGAIDTSANPHLDVNGDGFDDVAIGVAYASPNGHFRSGTVAIHHGGRQGIARAPTLELSSIVDEAFFGSSLASAGDVNGDGFGDLVVGAYHAPSDGRLQAGTVTVFHGGAMGLSNIPAQVMGGVDVADNFGASVAGAGDLNGDGYADLVVGAPAAIPDGALHTGTASVFYGSAMGVPALPELVLVGSVAREGFGCSVAGAGDLNGDGLSELVVGACHASANNVADLGTASVYLGRGMGVSETPSLVLNGPSVRSQFGFAVAGAGDLNNDGFGELVVGAPFAAGGNPEAGTASVFNGSARGVSTMPTIVLRGDLTGTHFGGSVASARDLNADGFGDLVVGSPDATPDAGIMAGIVSVFHGSAMGVPLEPAIEMTGVAANDHFGNSVAGAGDLNGDGYGDLLVGAYLAAGGAMIQVGYVHLYVGGARGITMDPTLILTGTTMIQHFGSSVAQLDFRRGHRRFSARSFAISPLIGG